MFRDFPIKSGLRVKQMKERFDSETSAEFIRFLRYAKRSCTEVQTCPPSLSLRRGGRGELYVALDEEYISPNEFKDVYEQAKTNPAKAGLPFVDSSTIRSTWRLSTGSKNMESAK